MNETPDSTEDGRATRHNLDESREPSPLRASGARPPLFCIFPGLPGARDIAEALPEDQPVYHFLLANLGRLSSFPTVEQLAESYVQGLRKVRAHGPYQLCGYSSGGLVAYEMARLLVEQGENVSFLALFDAWRPGFRQTLTLREAVRLRIIYGVDRLAKYGRGFIHGRFDDVAAGALEFVLKRVKLVGWRATRFIFRRTNRLVPQAMQVVDMMIALQAYTPKPYAKRFILFRPNDQVDTRLNDRTVGWHTCATAGVDVYFVPAEHGRMMDKPYVRSIVDRIAPYLADAPRP